MTIKRGIIGEKTGLVTGTIEIKLTEKELREAAMEYMQYYHNPSESLITMEEANHDERI